MCALFVTYFPDALFQERLLKVRAQVDRIIIVDNTDETGSVPPLDRLESTRIEIIRNGANLGVGQALNQGLARAMELGYRWAITFDQDSWVRPDLVQTLIDIHSRQPRPELVGIVGCNFEEEGTHTSPHAHNADSPLFKEVEAVVTSGSLVSLEVFSAAGPFRSDFFIDFVDHEYCLRLRKLGYKVVMAVKPLMVHALGEAATFRLETRVGTIPLLLTNRSPLRRYYMTRNGLLVAKNYFLVAPKWILRSLLSLLIFSPLKIPFEKDLRSKKFRATFFGFFDALRGKTGKASAEWFTG